MAMSTANRFNLFQVAVSRTNPPVAASTHIYQGTLVGINAGGYEVPLSDAANIEFDGFAESEANNTGGNGAITVAVTPRAAANLGVIELDAVSPSQSWVGQELAAADDHTAALLGQTNHVVRIGKCVGVISAAVAGRVQVDTSDIHTLSEDSGS